MTDTLLVIDDDESIRHAFRRAFRPPDFEVHVAASGAEGLRALPKVTPDVVILDVHLPDASGLEVFEQLRTIDARVPVIIVTGHGTTDLAIEAIKRGAYEYLLKPVELPQLRELVVQAAASSRRMNVPALLPEAAPDDARGDVLVGRCPAMQEVYKAIGRVAGQDVTVLILGESGTGKELVARAIYQHSQRAHRSFLAINCAAIPDNLLESELFGHEKGAFTGPDRQRIGKFEQCNGGTVFLDEVGDMSPLTQTKVLRLLQEQTFERVGGSELVRTDVRIIAATNADLESRVATGAFRKDLYFRLNVFTIRLPPLRERAGDIDLLIDHYARRFGRELHRPVEAIDPSARGLLRSYLWPGNVRELQSVVKTAVLHMRGPLLTADNLPESLASPAHAPAGDLGWEQYVAERIAAGSVDLYGEALARMEREVLTRVLRHTSGNQLQAARILGITRGSLRHKLRAHHIIIERSVWSDDDHTE